MLGLATRTLLVASADRSPAHALQRILAHENVHVEHLALPGELRRALEERDIEALFLAADLAEADASGSIASLSQRFPDVPLVVMVPPERRAGLARWVSEGATDFVHLPLDTDEALFTLRKLRSQRERVAVSDPPILPGSSGIVLQSPRMRALFELVDRIAAGNSTVMIRGESGTGKEVIARRIHEVSPRRANPFVKVHCAALPEQILESELFGYERGAFTGASARKPGRVELAEGGTLFLDEIGDITPTIQVKLLRILQDREYERLGGTHTLKANVRFLSATHRNLEKMVRAKEFREDLYYRLNVVKVVLPALKDRREDIAPMVRHFCAAAGTANAKPAIFDEDALPVFESSPWRGNVRQLQNFVERLVVLSERPRITRADVAAELAKEDVLLGDELTNEMSVIELDATLRIAERRALERALKKSGGNRALAARLLGVSRRTLFYKLRAHGIV